MIQVPGDKSISHRALLLASLGSGKSRLEGVLAGADCRSTAAALRAMGVELPDLPPDGGPFIVPGVGLQGLKSPSKPLDCGNSGTTARLLLGLLTGASVEATLTGDASLRTRPMARITVPLARAGAGFREEGQPGRLPMRVLGHGAEASTLQPIRHRSPVASAQVKSALLLAGLGRGISVEVTEPVASRDHTERMLRRLGVPVDSRGDHPHRVMLEQPPRHLETMDLRVPGDISSAAFLLVFGLLGGAGEELVLENVGLNPTRTGVLRALERMGATITRENARETDDLSRGAAGKAAGEPAGEPAADLVVGPCTLEGIEIGGAEIPSLIDEIPALAVAAVRARGTTVIRDAAELRVKESDRIRALVRNLAAVGVEAEELPDGLVVHGTDRPLKGRVEAFHDHRIAMAFGILGALPGNEIEVDDPDVARVSFPGFWTLLSRVGRETTGRGLEKRNDEPPSEARGGRAPVVTIDGPAGSGKSSTAREVARRLDFRHLDSGAVYRALTLALLEADVPEDSWADEGLARLQEVDVRLEPAAGHFRVLLDGRDPGESLRAPRVNERVSHLAAVAGIRERVVGPLREATRDGGVVADGRDMGTVVLPDADLKVFLTASLVERARRRILQEGREPSDAAVEREAHELERRDRMDRERDVAPLRKPAGAIELDTTALTFSQQVERIVAEVRTLKGGSGHRSR